MYLSKLPVEKRFGLINSGRITMPLSPGRKNSEKRYNLLFNGQIVSNNIAYPIAMAKRTEKMREWGIKNKAMFEIKRIN